LYFTLAGVFFYEILKNKKKKLFCAFVDFWKIIWYCMASYWTHSSYGLFYFFFVIIVYVIYGHKKNLIRAMVPQLAIQYQMLFKKSTKEHKS
jgi:hypothetical protein